MSAYKTAIDLTTQTIGKRARYYRNLIVIVVLIGLSSIGFALLMWSFKPLAGLLLLFPVCALFFLIDAKLLERWRSKLLQSWASKAIDFSALDDALNAISILPKETLQGMLATLPRVTEITAEQAIPQSTRVAVSAGIEVMYQNRSDLIAFKLAGFVVGVGTIMLAIVLSCWKALLLVVVVLISPLLQKRVKQWRLKKSAEKVALAQKQADFNQPIYLQLTAQFDEIGRV
jgi:hypothetical protein